MFMFINPAKTLTPWVSALEQESYLSYMKQVISNILLATNPSLIFKSSSFLFLDISCIILNNGHFRNLKTNQLLSKKELYYTHWKLSTIRAVIDT